MVHFGTVGTTVGTTLGISLGTALGTAFGTALCTLGTFGTFGTFGTLCLICCPRISDSLIQTYDYICIKCCYISDMIESRWDSNACLSSPGQRTGSTVTGQIVRVLWQMSAGTIAVAALGPGSVIGPSVAVQAV